jgi:hypothetical protein
VSEEPTSPEERIGRALIGGYDREQVEAALRERDERLEKLEREAQLLAGRVVLAENRAAEAGRDDPVRSRRIGGLTRRLRESAQDAMQRAESTGDFSSLREELGTLVAELAGLAGVRSPVAEERPAVGTEPASADRTYAGPVEVEVGPLRDFAQMTSFEDAVAEIDPSSSVQVRNFAGGRATFSMSFAQPVELVRELERRTPFPFSVRAAGAEGVVLDVKADAA